MLNKKPDAAEICAFLDELKGEPWLGYGQRHWPDYLFHVTNIDNAVSILKKGAFVSRNLAEELDLMGHDNASSEIIEHTGHDVRGNVRLYFRPRVPTSHNNEGIRPRNQRIRNAYCLNPVMFVLHSRQILAQSDSRFSDGSLARHSPGRRANIGSDATFLQSIPFSLVYHDEPFSTDEKEEIIFRRQAEVIVPRELSLAGSLSGVFTRSVAELETLLNTLKQDSPVAYLKHRPHIRVNTRGPLFHRKWTYLERVSLIGGMLQLEFNPSTLTPGPFALQINIQPAGRVGPVHTVSDERFIARGTVSRFIPEVRDLAACRIRVELDNSLVFDGIVSSRSALIS